MDEPPPERERREIRIELPHPMQVAAYRRMTPAQRLAAAFDCARFVQARLRAHFTSAHPEWSDAEIRRAVARRILGDAGRAASLPD